MDSRRIFHYEKKKISGRTLIKIEISLILLLFLGTVFQVFIDSGKGYTVAQGYHFWRMEEVQNSDSYALFQRDYAAYRQEINDYPTYLDQIKTSFSKNSLSELFQEASEYDLNNRRTTVHAYEKLRTIKVSPSYLWGISNWLNGSWQTILILFYVVIIGVKAFSGERTENRKFAYSTIHGRKAMSSIRLMTVLWKVTAMFLVGNLVSFAITMLVTPLSALSMSIQSVPQFISCSLKLQIWQFIILWMLMKWIGLVAVLLIIYLVCGLLWEFADAFVLSFVLLLSQFLLYNNIGKNSYLAYLHYVNLFNLLFPNRILQIYQNVNVYDLCVNALVLWIGTAVLTISLFYCFGSYFYRNYIPSASDNGIGRYLKRIGLSHQLKHKHILMYEGKLFFFISRGLLFITVFLVIILYSSYKERTFIDLKEYYYNTYASQIEKAEFLEQKILIGQIEEQLQVAMTEAQLAQQDAITVRQSALETIIDEYESIEDLRSEGVNCKYVNQTTWKKMFGYAPIERRIYNIFLILIFLLFPMFVWNIYERKYTVLGTFGFYPEMRRIKLHTVFFASIYGFIAWIVVLMKDLIPVVGRYEIYGWTQPCRSLLFLPEWTRAFSIGVVYIFFQLIKLFLILIIVNIPLKMRFAN